MEKIGDVRAVRGGVNVAEGSVLPSNPQNPFKKDTLESGNNEGCFNSIWNGVGCFFSSIFWFFGSVVTFVKERFFCWCFGRSDTSQLKMKLQNLLNVWCEKSLSPEKLMEAYEQLPEDAKTELNSRVGVPFDNGIKDPQTYTAIGKALQAYIATFE